MFGKSKRREDERMAQSSRYTRQDDYYGEDYDRRGQIGRGEDVRYADGRRLEGQRSDVRSKGVYERSGSSGRSREYRDDYRADYRGERRRAVSDRYREQDYAYDRRREAYPPRRKKRHTGRNILIVFLVIILALGGGAYAYLGRMQHTSLGDIITNESVSLSGYRNIVLYGVDSRTGDMTIDTHSDTIMICSINQKTREVRLASVYRDTYLDNTNGEYRKATECYYFGGPERSINMLNKNLDLDIADYITIDFAGVITVIDALGGIDLEITDEEMTLINGYCVENKEVTGVDYTPLTYSGYVHLEGIQALAYCRIRYTEGWDYKRTERQRTVMNLCFQKARQMGVSALPGIVNAVLPNLATSMSNIELLTLAGGLAGYSLGEQTGFPFDKQAADLADAGDCVVPVNLASNVSQLHAFLFDESNYSPSSTVQEISNTIISSTGIG